MGGWVSTNPNNVRICKSIRIIGRSLKATGANRIPSSFDQSFGRVHIPHSHFHTSVDNISPQYCTAVYWYICLFLFVLAIGTQQYECNATRCTAKFPTGYNWEPRPDNAQGVSEDCKNLRYYCVSTDQGRWISDTDTRIQYVSIHRTVVEQHSIDLFFIILMLVNTMQ